MPFQAPSWTEFFTCPICENEFSTNQRLPISLGCGHTICRVCLATVYSRQCPFDQTLISTDIDNLPINNALLQLLNSGEGKDNGGDADSNNMARCHNASASGTNANVKSNSGSSSKNAGSGNSNSQIFSSNNDNECSSSSCAVEPQMPPSVRNLNPEDLKCYKSAKKCIEELAQYLKSFVTNSGNTLLTRPMLRKLVTLVNCQLMEEEGRIRAVRTARFLGERTVTELLLQHQNPQQLSLCLWAAVRSRGCQFLGPSMQEEVLKLVLQALQNGSALSRKVLVMYVVQRLIDNLLPASKTSIGHVVQLLYRASCFKVSKREGDSSLMQLKEEFRNYESLRREHDAQIVQIATEAGLRIAPDQWSLLLYGNTSHKSHMQSICDTLQTPSSFAQSVQELVLALQRTGDPTNLSSLRPHLKHLASIDPLPETPPPTWQDVEKALDAVRQVVLGLVKFMQYQSNRKVQDYPMPPLNANGKYKISLCRDLIERRMCPRGTNCTFAHSAEERQRYRAKHRRTDKAVSRPHTTSSNVASSGSMHALDNIKSEFSSNVQQHSNTLAQHSQQQQHQNQNLDNGNSPVRMKPSPMRKYNNNNNNDGLGNVSIMRPNMMESSPFVGDMSATTSPLHHMQTSVNTLHASPIPPQQGHLLGINAPGSIINVPSMQKQPQQHNYENMPPHFSPISFGGGGKFVRIPNMRMPMSPNMRPPSLRGPISNSSGAGTIGAGGPSGTTTIIQSPRSSVVQNHPINLTTVVNPPNLQGTNSNKQPPGSPLHKHIYNNATISVDFYNTGGGHTPSSSTSSSFFTNANMDNGPPAEYPYRLSKQQKTPKSQSSLWDVTHQQLQPQQQSIINHSEFNPSQHHPMFMPPTQSQVASNQQQSPNESNVFFDKGFSKLTPKTNSCVDSLYMPTEGLIFKNSVTNKAKTKMPMGPSGINEKTNIFWHLSNNNNNQQTQHSHHNNNFGNSATEPSMPTTHIEPSTTSSLFRDRDSFVRSDSILDDDAATFDVPTTSTGNKFGPICPMYKGLASNSSATTNSFVDSWNALISQTANEIEMDNQCSGVTPSPNPNNVNEFSVFSLDNNNALQLHIDNHSAQSPSDHFSSGEAVSDGVAAAATVASTSPLNNFNNMQAALSKLSFINDSANEHQQHLNHFDFDLNSMYNILSGQNYQSDVNKKSSITDDLLWNSSGVNSSKTDNMNLGLKSFWNEDSTVVSGTTVAPINKLVSSSNPLSSHHHNHRQQQEQHQQQHQTQRHSQNLDDNELDITEIVDNIWPCGDDSGIKLD